MNSHLPKRQSIDQTKHTNAPFHSMDSLACNHPTSISCPEHQRKTRGGLCPITPHDTNFPKICTNLLKIFTNFLKTISKKIVNRDRKKRGHYERGFFTGGISRIAKFSRISRKWSDSPLASRVWGFSIISRKTLKTLNSLIN